MAVEKDNLPWGVIVPVITPIDENDSVDEGAFRAVLRRCLRAGVHGLFVGGSAGMGPMLTDAEWQRAMEIARDEVRAGPRLLGGIITTSTRRAVERIGILERIGYQIMVVTPTYYITLSRVEEMFSHFAACREAAGLEMVLYNIPSCTYSSIPPAVILESARRGWSRVCKESSGDQAYFSELLAKGNEVGLQLLQGHEASMEWALALGAGGIVPVCANYEPATFVTAWQAAQAGDRELLAKAQRRIDLIREALLLGNKNWIAGIMYAVGTLGIGTGRPLRPLLPAEGEAKESIDRLTCCADLRRWPG